MEKCRSRPPATWFLGAALFTGSFFVAGGELVAQVSKSAGKSVPPSFLLQRLDQNGDGKLSKEELPERLRQYFDRIDADHDGGVSGEELSKFAQSISKRFGAGRYAGGSESQAVMPRNVEWIAIRKNPDYENLILQSGRNLGETLSSAGLEELVAEALINEGVQRSSPRISDDRFVRRLFLDLIGQLPSPADIEEYLDDRSGDRKSKLIDRLLEMPQFSRNWARYWRDVIAYRATAGERRIVPFAAEEWLSEQIQQNASWAEIVTAMITAVGLSTETPEGFFWAAHMAEPEAMAGETSRVFLGLQISCAQCHDHPTDTWKRDQFYEFASLFGKVMIRNRQDLGRGPRGPIFEIVTRPPFRGDFRKPDLDDPSSPGESVQPVFLTGQPIPPNASDQQRRSALATFITSKRNPYFAKAYVNRIWAELIGYGFTNPVDDLGSYQMVRYPELFDALARSFAASDYDIKELMRLIVNSRVYDRQFGELENSYDQEILFQTVTPTRLAAEQIFDSLDWILSGVDDGLPAIVQRSASGQFRQVFGYDPSTDPRKVEGSIPQALVLMNNPILHTRIDADRYGTLLNKLLKTQNSDRDVVRMLYLRVLARKPTSQEVQRCLDYVRKVGDQQEGFEDILWALLNSTEFLNNH